jgi:heme oxygenase (biliverdin-IX-beta and delta-forming)
VPPVLAALRAATAEVHTALEAEAGIEPGLRSPDARVVIMRRLLALHDRAEAAVAPWRDAIAAEGYSPEPRAPLIRSGLEELGRGDVPPALHPVASTLGEALGWLYVAEGSMLGGRVMRKAMIADGIGLNGLGFLDPYRDETGIRWHAFVQAMESACASGRAHQGDVVRGGREAFECAFDLLAPTRRIKRAV